MKSNELRVEINGSPYAYRVWLYAGVQSFPVGPDCETGDEAQWYAHKLRKALSIGDDAAQPEARALLAHNTRAKMKSDLLLNAKIVVNDLACLIPEPLAPQISDWPCENPADRECLQRAYIASREMLHEIERIDRAGEHHE